MLPPCASPAAQINVSPFLIVDARSSVNPENFSAFSSSSDFLINYKATVQSLLSTPCRSTIFGTFVPNYPTPGRITREAGGFSHNLFPLWPIGGFYALSRDIVERLVSRPVERTVLKKVENYVFPEEDRAIGLALARSNTTVRNLVSAKSIFHFCEPGNFTCADYGHFLGFSIGFGKSGSGKTSLDTKMQLLTATRRQWTTCQDETRPSNAREHYFIVGDDFRKEGKPHDSLTYGCKSLSLDVKEFILTVKKEYKAIVSEEREMTVGNALCAERIYKEVYPEVNEWITNKTYSTGKEHFLAVGYLNESMHYYCPRVCKNNPSCSIVTNATLFQCNKEERYLRMYPEIHEAVKEGIFQDGREHFETHGQKEGRHYTCPVHDIFKLDSTGNKQGCYRAFETFKNKTKTKVGKWPVAGGDLLGNSSKICKALLFIEGRDVESADYVLRVHRRYTGPDWMFYLVGPKNVASHWRQLYVGPMVKVFEIPPEFGDLSDYPREINALLMSNWLWNQTIQCEHVLVTQSDALILRHGIEDFFAYSYVGAPVYPESHPSSDWRLVHAIGNGQFSGGNGGFSLRRRSAMLKQLGACEEAILQADGGFIVSEDGFFSSCLLKSGELMPTATLANRFSTGSTCEVDAPLGVHKLWQNCEESVCIDVIRSSALYQEFFSDVNEASDFCETGDTAYLAQYPDIMRAVKAGDFKNGFEHFIKYGNKENGGRKYRCMYQEIAPEEKLWL